jgi:hypothetical protein
MARKIGNPDRSYRENGLEMHVPPARDTGNPEVRI